MDTTAKLIAYVSDTLLRGRITVTAADDLLADDLVDSIGMMWLIAWLEEETGIAIPPEDITIEHFRTIRTISQYIDARTA